MTDSYAEVSPDGRDPYPVIVEKLRKVHELGPTMTIDDLATIRLPILVIVGDDDDDDDDMSLEHILNLYRAVPACELAIVPHASHGVLVKKPQLCHDLISEFLRLDKPTTFAPVRRTALEVESSTTIQGTIVAIDTRRNCHCLSERLPSESPACRRICRLQIWRNGI